jgi:hypothetical protein
MRARASTAKTEREREERTTRTDAVGVSAQLEGLLVLAQVPHSQKLLGGARDKQSARAVHRQTPDAVLVPFEPRCVAISSSHTAAAISISHTTKSNRGQWEQK